jgi:hypothetical protein
VLGGRQPRGGQMVRTFSSWGRSPKLERRGAIAQLGERLLCKQEVTGSIPVGSISEMPANWHVLALAAVTEYP